MRLIKKIGGLRSLRSGWGRGTLSILLAVLMARSVAAETCSAPVRPFVPRDPQAAQDYADIIRSDFELYIRDIQRYLRCLDTERARAFVGSLHKSDFIVRLARTLREHSWFQSDFWPLRAL